MCGECDLCDLDKAFVKRVQDESAAPQSTGCLVQEALNGRESCLMPGIHGWIVLFPKLPNKEKKLSTLFDLNISMFRVRCSKSRSQMFQVKVSGHP